MQDGYAELAAKLQSIAGEGRVAAERKALKAVGQLVQAAIVARAPVQSTTGHGDLAPGELKADIKARVHIANDEKAATDFSRVTVGPTKKTAYVANFVENGHANPKAQKGLKNTPAHPFIRPAADSTKQEATELYTEILTEEIQKVMNG